MAHIRLEKVHARYELLSVLDYNLKHRLVETIRRKNTDPVTIDALSHIDLVVPDRDFFACPEDDIAQITSLLTVVGGRVVFAAGDFAAHDTPPPPANQILHVRPKSPAKFRAMDTVWVTGKLVAQRNDSMMGTSGYTMTADTVTKYTGGAK